jgi:hypothetical protein
MRELSGLAEKDSFESHFQCFFVIGIQQRRKNKHKKTLSEPMTKKVLFMQ